MTRSAKLLVALLATATLWAGCGDKKKPPANPNDVKSKQQKQKIANQGDATINKNQGQSDIKDNKAAAKTTAPPAAAPAAPAAAPVSDGPKPIGIVNAARASLRAGRYNDALRAARRALSRSEKYIPAMVVLAQAYFRLGKLGFVDQVCSRALDITKKIGACYDMLGLIQLKENKPRKALANFKTATEKDPGYAPAWLNYGAMALKVKNYDAAVSALETAAQKLPNVPEVHLNLGAAYRGKASASNDAQTLVKARSALLKALRLRSNYAAALYNLGILYLDAKAVFDGKKKIGRLDAAITYFSRYKTSVGRLPQGDPVDDYIKAAERDKKRALRRQQRAARRKARAAAKKAASKKTPPKKK